MDAELPLDGALDPQEKLKTKSDRILLDVRATLLVCFESVFHHLYAHLEQVHVKRFQRCSSYSCYNVL